MSRKKRTIKKQNFCDAKFQNRLIGKFINMIMMDGKKSLAESIVYNAFDLFIDNTKKETLESFKISLRNIMPEMEVKSRRVGGSTYQVPVEVRASRSESLAMRWIVLHAKKRSGKTMVEKLAAELTDAYNKSGGSFKKKEDTHKMAEANKAFAHFRW